MSVVKVPSNLMKGLGNKSQLSVQGETLLEALQALEGKAPGFLNKVVDANGEIRRFIRVCVDGQMIEEGSPKQVKIKADSKIQILMALAGG